MRAFLLTFLLVFAVSANAEERILSGDSGQAYVPPDSGKEVLLYRFSFQVAQGSYSSWPFGSYTSPYNTKCLKLFAFQPASEILLFDECTNAVSSFKTAKEFVLTRVVMRNAAVGPFQSQAFAQTEQRVVSVSPAGAIVEIGAPQSIPTGVGATNTWYLDVKIPAGTGVSIQQKPDSTNQSSMAVYEPVGTFPTYEFWGIFK